MKNKLVFTFFVLSFVMGSIVSVKADDQFRWNVLMLGDSITEYSSGIIGGYPEAYSQKLEDEFGIETVYKFIGRLGSTDVPREGYSGKTSGFIADILKEDNSNGLYQYLDENPPDVVLLHISTNDLWNYTSPDVVEENIRDIIEELKSHNPGVIVCLAKIIPYRALIPLVIGAKQRVNNYNERIAEIGADTANIDVVDQNTGFIVHFSWGGIHPNLMGQAFMANNWYDQCPSVYQYE